MDDAVLRAMARWPDVPAVFGWLSLDARGRWLLKGETIGNRQATAFIDRNYAADGDGCWYFQNGPQRVYVSLEYTPWVLRVSPDGTLETHTGRAVSAPQAVFVDEEGNLLVATEHGIALVADRDLEPISEAIAGVGGEALDPEQVAARLEAAAGASGDTGLTLTLGTRRLPIEALCRAEVATRFGFQPSPAADQNA